MACIRCRDFNPYSCSICSIPDRTYPDEFILSFNFTQRANSGTFSGVRLGAAPVYQCLGTGCTTVNNCEICDTYGGTYILSRSAPNVNYWTYTGNISETPYLSCYNQMLLPTITINLTRIDNNFGPIFASDRCPFAGNEIRLTIIANDMAFTCTNNQFQPIPFFSVRYLFPTYSLFDFEGSNEFLLTESGGQATACLCEFPATISVSAL